MHFQVPCFGVMDDLTDVVHRALDGTTPPWGVRFVNLHGLGPRGLVVPGIQKCLRVPGRSSFEGAGPRVGL
jgi:hypothetical protein